MYLRVMASILCSLAVMVCLPSRHSLAVPEVYASQPSTPPSPLVASLLWLVLGCSAELGRLQESGPTLKDVGAFPPVLPLPLSSF